MSNTPPQNFSSHGHLIPGFHGVTALILLANLIWSVWSAIGSFSTGSLIAALTALALVMLFLYARSFATHNQDRIIRLEERLRLREVLPDDLRGRIDELSTDQLIGLRFASDEELADLTRKVLEGGVTGRPDIKRQIKNWRPDYQRV